MRAALLWWAMFRMGLHASMQYRVNFLLQLGSGLLAQTLGLAFAGLLVQRFGAIGGWTLAEIAAVYGLRQLVHGIWVLLAGDLVEMPTIVREGDLDRYLVRPISPLVQVMTLRVNVGALGELCAGLTMLIAGVVIARDSWPLEMITFLPFAIIGGVLTEGAMYLALAALSTRVVEMNSALIAVNDVSTTFGAYPLHAFSRAAQALFTFVLPIAFVAYLPGAVLLGMTGNLTVPAFVAFLSPLVGAALFAGALLVWRSSLSHYQGVGN